MAQLYCLPVPCRCGRHGRYRSVYGTVHGPSEECPLWYLHALPVSPCCALYAECARKNLIAVGEKGLARDMENDLSCEEALQLGLRIQAWIGVAEDAEKRGWQPAGRLVAVSLDGEAAIRATARATFQQALMSILIASCWYIGVGNRGYGVKAQWR